MPCMPMLDTSIHSFSTMLEHQKPHLPHQLAKLPLESLNNIAVHPVHPLHPPPNRNVLMPKSSIFLFLALDSESVDEDVPASSMRNSLYKACVFFFTLL